MEICEIKTIITDIKLASGIEYIILEEYSKAKDRV